MNLPFSLLQSIQFGKAMLQLSSTPGKGFWAQHRWKMLLSLGVAGTGYAEYRFYDAHQRQLVRVE
jgi:peroxin-3